MLGPGLSPTAQNYLTPDTTLNGGSGFFVSLHRLPSQQNEAVVRLSMYLATRSINSCVVASKHSISLSGRRGDTD